ncbi:MAG: hypothetical protein IPH88_16305 [Bacteroidales bacterium]|nr:hypothetical protein [Bacteroidales bacterium]
MTKDSYKHFDLSKEKIPRQQILGWRESEYIESLFYHHEVYDQIRYSINNKDITLILGNPLSGKTRIVYDTLKENTNWNVLIPRKDKSIEEYILPTHLNNRLVLFDDIDDYCHENNFALNKLMKYIVMSGIKCIITCRTGPEYDKFRRYIERNLFYKVAQNRFHIPRFDKNSPGVAEFLNNNITEFKSNIKNFDGNFGSIVLPLDAMRDRFQFLKDNEKDKAVALLLGLKLHFHFLNYEGSKSEYDDAKIKMFCEKYLSEELTMYEWEEAKNDLESNETSLNFIESTNHICIEEAYLDFLYDSNGNISDVVHDEFNEKRLTALFEKLYKLEEKQAWGFPVTTFDLNRLIKLAPNYKAGKEIFNKIRIQDRNSYSYTYLMFHCEDKTELIKLYQEMRHRRISTLFAPNYTFIGKFDSFIELFDTLKEFDERLLEHLNGTTRRLINLAELKPAESLAHLFAHESLRNIYTNPVYNQLLRTCCMTVEDYNKYLKPALNLFDSLDYNLRKNLIKSIIKLKLVDIATPLVETYLIGYDFHNELGNCYMDVLPAKSLECYLKSLELAETLSHEQKSLININSLILNHPQLFDDTFTSNIVIKSHQFLKNNHTELQRQTIRYTDKLRIFLLINEIRITDKADIQNRLDALFKAEYIPRKTFIHVLRNVDDTEKKDIINDFLVAHNNKKTL